MKDSPFQRFLNGFIFIFTNYTWSFVIIISLTIISSAFSIHYLNMLESEFDQIFQYDIAGRTNIKDAYSMILKIDSALKDLRINKDDPDREQTLDIITSNTIIVTNLVEKTGWRFEKQTERKIYITAKQDLSDFIEIINSKVIELKNNNEIDDEFLYRLRSVEDRLLSDFNSLVSIKRNSIGRVFGNIKLQLETSLILTSLLLILTILIRAIMYFNGRKKKNDCK